MSKSQSNALLNYPSKIWKKLVAWGNFTYRRGKMALGFPTASKVYYLIPGVNWSLDWDGYYITRGIRERFEIGAYTTHSAKYLVNHIVHYGSLWSFLANIGSPHTERNKLVGTIFHGNRTPDMPPEIVAGVERFLENADSLQKVVTSCSIMRDRLVNWGVSAQKVVCIPLGIDLQNFHPVSQAERQHLRSSYGIAQDAFCIGSFHKDGVGFEEGLEPKLIKGPDVFVEVIERLSKQHKLHVFLTAPARGYVKRGLEKIGVPYTHIKLDDFREVATYYNLLDLYLVTSREEGGPKGVLESLASGVPLVSTKVGLAPDVIEDGYNGLLANVEDVDALAQAVSRVIADSDLSGNLTTNGLQTIRDYDWSVIAAQYYHQVYRPVLDKLKE